MKRKEKTQQNYSADTKLCGNITLGTRACMLSTHQLGL